MNTFIKITKLKRILTLFLAIMFILPPAFIRAEASTKIIQLNGDRIYAVTATSVFLSWFPLDYARENNIKDEVYVSKSPIDGFTKAGSVKQDFLMNYMLVKGLEKDTQYYFMVKCYDVSEGKWFSSDVVAFKTPSKGPSMITATTLADGMVKLEMPVLQNSNIFYSDRSFYYSETKDGTYKKITDSHFSESGMCVINGLKPGKTYYFKSSLTVDQTTYSAGPVSANSTYIDKTDNYTLTKTYLSEHNIMMDYAVTTDKDGNIIFTESVERANEVKLIMLKEGKYSDRTLGISGKKFGNLYNAPDGNYYITSVTYASDDQLTPTIYLDKFNKNWKKTGSLSIPINVSEKLTKAYPGGISTTFQYSEGKLWLDCAVGRNGMTGTTVSFHTDKVRAIVDPAKMSYSRTSKNMPNSEPIIPAATAFKSLINPQADEKISTFTKDIIGDKHFITGGLTSADESVQNLFLIQYEPDTGSEKIRQLTSYAKGSGYSVRRCYSMQTANNELVILYQINKGMEHQKTCLVKLNQKGTIVSWFTIKAELSAQKPVMQNGKIYWLSTMNTYVFLTYDYFVNQLVI